ncbi:MAG: YkgJ family cysteine cluster protein [Candidatus Latescibacteria bacterium]|jgi:Fe-S-cluster containining protein|nr:YkgJ family cysteine cluster protein [Candidatus Latescibacterota bacterium]
MTASITDLASDVEGIYREIDGKIDALRSATGLGCPPGCGRCCWHPDVVATVVEVIPFALEVWEQGREEFILELLEEKAEKEDSVCVAFRPDPDDLDKGRCEWYPQRPLMCRLFGFAARRGKQNRIEVAPCRILKDHDPGPYEEAQAVIDAGLDVPIYTDYSMRASCSDPGLGLPALHINLAIRRALEHVYWKRRQGSEAAPDALGRPPRVPE